MRAQKLLKGVEPSQAAWRNGKAPSSLNVVSPAPAHPAPYVIRRAICYHGEEGQLSGRHIQPT